jgi:hypothetical protein
LELKYYTVETKSGDEGKEILLKPGSSNSELKTYVLTSKESPKDVDEWATVFEKVIKYRCLKPASADQSPTKSGWLEKKGSKRFFILKDEILYWFSKEQV